MNRRFVADLLLITALLAAALCVARGFLLSSTASFLGGWALVLCGIVIWLLFRREPEEPLLEMDDTLL